jgi:DNA-binding MarR family transcriptional regulator
MCEDDRRGIFVSPTDAGIRRHAEARLTHRAVLAEHLDGAPASL